MKFRYGGDEFLIMLPETNLDEAKDLALRLNEAVKKMQSSIDMQITTSLGVAEFEPDDTLEGLIKKADLALYDAKEKGRDSVIISKEQNKT
jgi:diguanylate cyclase (GGDEF)-like protein